MKSSYSRKLAENDAVVLFLTFKYYFVSSSFRISSLQKNDDFDLNELISSVIPDTPVTFLRNGEAELMVKFTDRVQSRWRLQAILNNPDLGICIYNRKLYKLAPHGMKRKTAYGFSQTTKDYEEKDLDPSDLMGYTNTPIASVNPLTATTVISVPPEIILTAAEPQAKRLKSENIAFAESVQNNYKSPLFTNSGLPIVQWVHPSSCHYPGDIPNVSILGYQFPSDVTVSLDGVQAQVRREATDENAISFVLPKLEDLIWRYLGNKREHNSQNLVFFGNYQARIRVSNKTTDLALPWADPTKQIFVYNFEKHWLQNIRHFFPDFLPPGGGDGSSQRFFGGGGSGPNGGGGGGHSNGGSGHVNSNGNGHIGNASNGRQHAMTHKLQISQAHLHWRLQYFLLRLILAIRPVAHKTQNQTQNLSQSSNRPGKRHYQIFVRFSDAKFSAILEKKCADLSAKDSNNRTLLHYIAMRGWPLSIASALKHGANPNESDINACLPLHFAVLSRSKKTVQTLVSQSTVESLQLRDNNGNSCLMLAKEIGAKGLTTILEDALVQYLEEKKAQAKKEREHKRKLEAEKKAKETKEQLQLKEAEDKKKQQKQRTSWGKVDSGKVQDLSGIKLVVVGDGAVGKTCLLISYANNRFPQDYVPTVFDNYVVNLTAGGRTIELGLWDTAGQEEYDRLRPLSYANANVFLTCFSVVNPVSYENILSKWYPEICHFCPDAPLVLVGTKCDLRNDSTVNEKLSQQGQAPVTLAQAETLAKTIKAVDYVECSAYDGTNLKLVFDTAVKTCLFRPDARSEKKRLCILV
eukprot:TRINITY_DN6112_c0_g2_i1.p1 TRINITY_DN6112_c0_g2~~TRINITY_DN6112_c0_g2_i1.p1  ORF type:complete len:846 (+),score=155.24 TRINITY_DN6112_c0_g2_i1:122-2539(+)